MSRSLYVIPPLQTRLAEGRPVLTQEQITRLAKRVMNMTSATSVGVTVAHTAYVITRMANDQILSNDDGDTLSIDVIDAFAGRLPVRVHTNQLDDSVLHAIVQYCEGIARSRLGMAEDIMPTQLQVPDQLVPAKLWHANTIRAMAETRGTLIPDLITAVTREHLTAAGFVGFMARSEALITKSGVSVYHEETDSEITVTARSRNDKSSGWGGQAARDWSVVQPRMVAANAVRFAKMGINPVTVEPGRWTAILSATAVVQIIRCLAAEYDALDTDRGETAFSRIPRGNKLGQHVFDPRISMRSDPADPEGGYRPYFMGAETAYGTPPMSWVEEGVLKNLAYNVPYALQRGKAYAEPPYSLRLSGGTMSIEDIIARCKEGIYVNRFSGVDLVDVKTGLTSGVTRDGCFLVKNGKIDRPVKNFRFLDSPFFFLNNVEALGIPERAAFGYTPPSEGEQGPTDWPRRPIIVPPMMVRDFNFVALSDAV